MGEDVEIRAFRLEDADAVSAAVVSSLDELLPWMPWAAAEPIGRAAREELIAGWADGEARGGDRVRGIWVGGVVAGTVGLHDRLGDPAGREIGYWVRTAFAGRGVATAAVGLVVAEAWRVLPDVAYLESHPALGTARSGAVARAAGFTDMGTFARDPEAPGETGVRRRWRLERPS
jgi:ribosomal-protein-serine acetyltransferase